MIGLSLSLCVRDLLSGDIDIRDVEKIISGTCAYTPERLNRLVKEYSATYWGKYPADEINIVLEWIMPILEQPRIDDGGHFPMIYNGHWVNSEDEIIWSDAHYS